MKELKREFTVEAWDESELPEGDRALLKAAHAAALTAYAPYSNFRVGAAVRLSSGEIVKGSNQENMAYPSGLCAERTAFFAAGSQFPNEKIQAAAVVTDREMASVDFSPCGGCRQVMLESEHRNGAPIRFLMQPGAGEVLVSKNVSQFLPLTFRLP
jgi:cytidine deaminase